MLSGTPTKNGAGIKLSGDFFDLASLRETINDIVIDNPYFHHQEFMLALSYDIRHASQGDRETVKLSTPYGKTTYHAVNILWPMFLVQVSLLRAAAAYTPTTKEQQANMLLLENSGKNALSAMNPATAEQCSSWLDRPSSIPEDYLIDFVENQSYLYVTSAKTAAKRMKILPTLMAEINAYSEAYKRYAEAVPIHNEMQVIADWPDFKW